MLTLIVLGADLSRVPACGTILRLPPSAPNPQALYEARLAAALAVETPFFTMLDGGPDILLPGYEHGMQDLCEQMELDHTDIGSCLFEIGVSGKTKYLNHGVVCRTAALRNVRWPRGLFHFEVCVYGRLAERGVTKVPRVVYRWVPSEGGANTWPQTSEARMNAARWLHGQSPLRSVLNPTRKGHRA